MALGRLSSQNREEWLAARATRGIGGSEAAAAAGISPWETPLGLWKRKTGLTQAKDLSGNEAVERGIRWEPALREVFQAMHPEYRIEYHQFDLLFQEERPWLYATLDGELKTDGAGTGILEIKTASPNGKPGWDKWRNGRMPDYYYAQCLHQMLATGYGFVCLFAALFSTDGDITLREFEIRREDTKQDMEWLLEREERFWDCVTRRVMPPTPIF